MDLTSSFIGDFHVNDQVFSFASNYLSSILNLNILLMTAGGILLLSKNNTCWTNGSFILSLVVSFISTILILCSQRDFFDFLLQYDPKKIINVIGYFKKLDFVFWLDIAAIVFIALGIFGKLNIREKNKNG